MTRLVGSEMCIRDRSNIMRVEPLARSLRMKAEQLGFGADIGAAEFQ
jgi:hypothetical protein